ncbi:lytic transglycosylase domain-containing protein [Asaia spathodeae]|uniref:Lytic transglycosylase domain-containing protein n=1 Tax=Asaia spathodeae TaxID=657016 RepID=A0ABX2P7K4_9PROT|nr:lytic transglycosylase domain-containing protein [Asaia spathodeae]GBR19245.1 murein transglycosylase [Asaia spathodeae NBRC 105894]
MSRVKAFLLTGSLILLTGCSSHAQEQETPSAASETLGQNDSAPESLAPPSGAASTDVATRLDQWLALVQATTPPSASAYADFLDQTPSWPERAVMMARYQQALATRASDAELPQLCPREPLTAVQAFMRCATLLPDAASQARRIWRNGADRETDSSLILAEYSASLTPDDHWARFQRQIRTRQFTAAGRQVSLLAPQRQAGARALIALQSNAPDAASQFAALPASQRAEPQIMIARLRQLRRAPDLDSAYALWQEEGFAGQKRAPSSDWTNERLALARSFLTQGSVPQARALADDTTLSTGSTSRLEAFFLRGWIDLRFQKNPALARPAFAELSRQTSLITKSRGYYWLGRSFAEEGNSSQASAAYRQAATMPTTYYGQLALAALGGHDDTLVPGGSDVPGLATALSRLPALQSGGISRGDLIEAARLLHERGDDDHAREFLMLGYSAVQDAPGQAALARFALSIGSLEPAVFAARRTGRLGSALYPEGWPVLDAAQAEGDSLPHGLALGVARQESSFDAHVSSPARAIGLMQLQTGTAQDVARRAGLSGIDTSASGLRDPATNLVLGRTYLSQLMTRFNNVVPLVLSAYNAGPHRTDLWLASQPLPQPLTQAGMIDWIEGIPYEETRSYIQRVEENMALYRVLETNPHG